MSTITSNNPNPLPGGFPNTGSNIGAAPSATPPLELGTVIKAGGKGRMGTWAYSYGFTTTAGLGEFGKRIVEGKAKLSDRKALLASYGKYSPGAAWNGNSYYDSKTGVKMKGFYLIYQDTYIFGKGYLGMTKVTVPEKYLKIKMKAGK